MTLIEIGKRNYLLYLILSHPIKMALRFGDSRARLDQINAGFNDRVYSGDGATDYDRIHSYEDDAQHEYPAGPLVSLVWGADGGGYGNALELGAGSGYFTALIARRARSVIAIEPVEDLQKVAPDRCDTERLNNVRVIGSRAFDLSSDVHSGSVDSAFIIQSLDHFHRRPDVFAELGRVVRPGGRLYLVEPHHNVRRVARLVRKYHRPYRHRGFWADEKNWATHDFLTRGELRALCRHGGFENPRIEAYWIPSPERRFRAERILGRIPVLRHAGSILAMQARRKA